MDTKPAQFTAETENLLIALYSRAHDAKSAKPILGDRMAVKVSESIEYDYSKLKMRDDDAISLAIRGELIDGWIRSFLDEHPDAVVLHLGTGLDGRVHRIEPPATVEWYDLDLPEIAELYRGLFPTRDHHHIIGSSVMDLAWLEQVPTDRPTIIVAEGLLVYFTEDEVKNLVQKLFATFPSGQLVFDAYTPFSVKAMNKHWTVKASGKKFVWGLAEPASLEQWHPGVTHNDAWTFFKSPYIAHMPWTSRVVCKIMNAIPALRHYNRVMRYSF
ncbi:class I SAM-dependent methyltransferase [Streptomyces sp. NA04227]|uniref:class I SAM-dependent methyltransferase n=1 Tax=Streptomyces sp. NA04227 TaxID=2742136 RepID=UPI001591735A|nr:class I SAM-dependent methyltransferase [Streptomyces sp. NA04227]QKW05110.1 class I SAM-dependent methyltransferase [Streptomyces sp. NA04227]